MRWPQARGQAIRLLQDTEQPALMPLYEGEQPDTPTAESDVVEAFEHFSALRPRAFSGLDSAQRAYARGALVVLVGAVNAGELGPTDVLAALQLIAAGAAEYRPADVTSAPVTEALVTRPIPPLTRPDAGDGQTQVSSQHTPSESRDEQRSDPQEIGPAERNAQGLPLAEDQLAANEWYYSRGNAEDAARRFRQLAGALQNSRASEYVVELQRADGSWSQLNVSSHGRDGNYYSLSQAEGTDLPIPADDRGWPLLPVTHSNELVSIENADIGDIHVARNVAPSELARSRAESEPSISNLVHSAALGLDNGSGIEQIKAQLASVLADPKSVAPAIASFNSEGEPLRRIDDAVNQLRLVQTPPYDISASDLARLGWSPPQYGLVLARGPDGDIEAFAIKCDDEDVFRLFDAEGRAADPNWRDYREVTFVPTYDTPAVALPDIANQQALQEVHDAYRSLPVSQRKLRERVVREVSDTAHLTIAQQSLYHDIANVGEPVGLAVRYTRERERLSALLEALKPLGVRATDDIRSDFEARVSVAEPDPAVGPSRLEAATEERAAIEHRVRLLPSDERASRFDVSNIVRWAAHLTPFAWRLYELRYVYGIPEEVLRLTEPPICDASVKESLEQALKTHLGLEGDEAIRADFAARLAQLEE
jgi:hypothetical protein